MNGVIKPTPSFRTRSTFYTSFRPRLRSQFSFLSNDKSAAQRRIPRRRESGVCGAMGVDVLFAGCTLYVIPFYVMMIFFPRSERTQRILISPNVFIPLALVYSYLLVASWEKDTLQLMMPGDWREGFKSFSPQFFPQLRMIQILFSRVITAASLWVHIVAVNFFFARHVYLTGLIKRIPTGHTCLISLFLGPLGIVSSCITEVICKAMHDHKRSQNRHHH